MCEHTKTVKDVICEDSAAIATIYSDVLECDVCSAGSRSGFISYMKNDVAFLIADKPKFGQELLSLIYFIDLKELPTSTLLLFLPSCFEEIICDLAEINDDTIKFDDYFDAEIFFEKLSTYEEAWNKKKVAASIFELHNKYNFRDSDIIQDLIKFYHGCKVAKSDRCYAINVHHNIKYTYQNYKNDKLNIELTLKQPSFNGETTKMKSF